MSNKILAFDPDKLNKFVIGDLGIADLIHKNQITPILAAIPNAKDKEIFYKLQIPNKKTGLWAMEKTIVSSTLESQKPLIELVKVLLELFAGLEYTITSLTGGSNPENDVNSFYSAFTQNKDKHNQFKTNVGTPPTPDAEIVILPPIIFLGKYNRSSNSGDVSANGSGPEHGEFYNGLYWPQYQSKDEFENEQINKLNLQISSLDDDTKKLMIDGRKDSIDDEWNGMQDTNQIKKNYEPYFFNNIKKYFKPQTVTYLNKQVDIDIEDDYNINVDKQVMSNNFFYREDHYIIATLKDDAKPTASGTPKNPKNLPGSILRAIKAFIKKVLPVIVKKLIPIITAIKKIISNPVEFIGTILMTKLKEHFEMFDPSLKNKSEDDPDHHKYWSGKNFVMDGTAILDVGLLKITMAINTGLPTFKIGTDKKPKKENPILKQVANMVALPINFLKGILDAINNFFKKLFKVKELSNVFSDLVSLNWVKDLLSTDKIFEFLGAKNGDITTIPFLNIPKAGNLSILPEVIKGFIKMIMNFINGFIDLPNTLFNMELVPHLKIHD